MSYTDDIKDDVKNEHDARISVKLEEWLKTFYNWSNNDRIAALELLITSNICDVQQMRHLLSLIEPKLQRDFISLLPKELSLYVLSFLEPPVLLKAAQTCRYWRVLCEDNLLWREKCREEGLLEDHETFSDFFRNRRSRANRLCLNSNSPTASNDCTTDASNASQSENIFYTTNYKSAYLRQKSIEMNWRFGQLNYSNSEEGLLPNTNNNNSNNNNNNPSENAVAEANNQQPPNGNEAVLPPLLQKVSSRQLKEILHLKGHEDHVITCLQFNPISNIIVSGSDDNTLKVWSSITGRCLRTLNGHSGGVWSSQLSPKNIVISGSTDRTLRVWNALDGICTHVLYGHTSTVRCMALNGNYVVSGSRDATLRVWNIDTGTCEHVLIGHLAAVRCVQFNGKLCVSGAYDFLVKVWDVASETCLHTLEGHTNRVYSLQFDGIHIVSGSLDTSIRVWSADSGKLKHTLVGHQSLTSGMQLRGNILVSGNADSTVKVWDINTGQCLQTLSGQHKHQSAVTCLQFNSKFVITSSDDGTVKLWDLKTGEFIRNLIRLPSGGSGGVVWRIRASNTKLVCAVGSRNGTEETKLLVIDFEIKSTNKESGLEPDLSNELLNQSPTSISNESDFLPTFGQNIKDIIIKAEQSSMQFEDYQCLHEFSSNAQHENSAILPSLTSAKAPILPNYLSDSTSTSTLSSLSSTPSSSHVAIPTISLQSIMSNSANTNFAGDFPSNSKFEFNTNGCQSLSSPPKADQEDGEETKSNQDDDSQPMEHDF